MVFPSADDDDAGDGLLVAKYIIYIRYIWFNDIVNILIIPVNNQANDVRQLQYLGADKFHPNFGWAETVSLPELSLRLSGPQ